MNHYLETSGEKPALNWLLSDQSKIGNYSDDRSEWESYWQDGKDRQDYAIEPGTSGELSFYVVPHNDGNVTLRCNLGVIPYKVDESGNYNEIMDTNVCNFLQGHILFFLKYLDENNTESIAWIKDGMGQETAKAFVNLSSYYNQADQFIGNSVDCLRICLTAEPEIGE